MKGFIVSIRSCLAVSSRSFPSPSFRAHDCQAKLRVLDSLPLISFPYIFTPYLSVSDRMLLSYTQLSTFLPHYPVSPLSILTFIVLFPLSPALPRLITYYLVCSIFASLAVD